MKLTTTTLQKIADGHYRPVRAEIDHSKLQDAFQRVKADTDKIETAIANDNLQINAALVKQILIYLLALGRLVIELSIRMNRLEKR